MKTIRVWTTIFTISLIITSFRLSLGQTPTPSLGETPKERAILLTQDTDICRLPCFWGFMAGETSKDHIKTILQSTFPEANQFDKKWTPSVPTVNNNLSAYEFNLFSQDEIQITMNFIFQDEILDHGSIYFPFYQVPVWLPPNTLDPSNILSTVETVPDIYIGFFDTFTRAWTIIMAFEDFVIEYTLEFEKGQFIRNSDTPIEICADLENSLSIYIYIQQPNDPISVEDRIHSSTSRGWLQESTRFRPVEFVTGLTSGDFVETLVEHPDECIETYSYNELKSKGQDF